MTSSSNHTKLKILGGLLLVVILSLLPLFNLPGAWKLYIFLFFIYLSLANMWNMLAGYSGLTSLCQPAFIGLAGYALVIATWSGLPFWIGILAGIFVSGLFALLISIPVFRLSGIYFAIGTLVVPEALRVVFLLWRPVGGALHGSGAGYRVKGLDALTMDHTYWMGLFAAVLSVLIIRFILSSRLGLGLAAIRDSDSTAASAGVDVFKLKLLSFVIAAMVTGMAGGIYYAYQKYIEPTSAFNINWTMILMLSAVIGGLGIEIGPAVGVMIVIFLHFFLAQYGGWALLLQGIMLVLVMLLLPHGIMGFVMNRRK